MEPQRREYRLHHLEIAEPSHIKKDLATLFSIIVDISSSELRIDELLPKIIRHATVLCDADSGAISLIDEKTKTISNIYQYHMPESIANLEIPYGKGAYFDAVRKRKIIMINNYSSYEHRIDEFVKAGIKAVLAAPIVRQDRVLGTLTVIHTKPGKRFTQYHAELLEGVAAQAAIGIEHADLFDELKKSTAKLKERSENLQALLNVSLDITSGLKLDDLMYKIARYATELTNSDVGAVGLLDYERRVVTYRFIYNLPEIFRTIDIPFDSGMSGIVLNKKGPVYFDDYQAFPQRIPVFTEAGLHAIAMVPLITRSKITGIIWVSSKDPEHKMNAQDIEALEGMGRYAALALENAQLYEDARKRTERLTLLFEISQTINSGLQLNEVFKRAVNAIETVFDVKAVWVTLYNESQRRLQIAEYDGPFRDEIMQREEITPAYGLDEFAFTQNKPQIVTDIETDLRLRNKKEALKLDAHSIISVPITSKGKSIGTIGVGSVIPADTPRGKEQIDFLEIIASTVATAVENARLYESIRGSEEEARDTAKSLAILNNLSGVISGTLELNEVLDIGLDSVMDLFESDGAAIFFLDEKRRILEMVGSRGLSDTFIELSKEIGIGDRLPGIVANTGKPIIVPELDKVRGLEAPIAYEKFSSMIAAPIRSKGAITGVIALGSRLSSKFDQSDAELLESIGNEIGIAIENSRLYETQRTISEALQRSMLPTKIPSIPQAEIGVVYRSATEEAKVGGDFYDIFKVDDKYALVIGDVSGKGIEAASSTSMIKHAIRAYMYQEPSPSLVMSQANNFVLRQIESNVFITVFCAVFDPISGDLTFVNAGHPFPCLLDQVRKTCTLLVTNDPAIGFMENYSYNELTVGTHPGNLFVAYTDGVIETRHGKEFFGDERLVNTLLNTIDLPSQKIADSIINACLEFSHGRLLDDIAILVIRRVP